MSALSSRDRDQTLAQRRPVYRLPLLRVVCKHGIGLLVVHPRPCPVSFSSSGPFVAVLDDRSPSGGPAAFDLDPIMIMLRRVRGALVLTGDCAPSYTRVASIVSSRPVSMVLVETALDHGEPWRALIQAAAPALPVLLKHN